MTAKQFRVLAALTVGSGLLGSAVFSLLLRGGPAMAQEEGTGQAVVTARRFELVDEQGQSRAVMAMTKEGTPALVLSDAAGKGRAWLTLRADGSPRLDFRDASGRLRAVVGESTITLCKRDGAVAWQAP
jgi:hypothetical protein